MARGENLLILKGVRMSEHSFSRTAPPASSLASLRARLQQARHQRHWSQQELADLLGTTPLNISRWVHGLTTPNPYFRHKLRDLFGKSEIELGLRSDPTFPASTHAEQQERSASRFPLVDPFLPLPAAVPLVRRAGLLGELKSQLHDTRAIALSALHGLPAWGKTALAL